MVNINVINEIDTITEIFQSIAESLLQPTAATSVSSYNSPLHSLARRYISRGSSQRSSSQRSSSQRSSSLRNAPPLTSSRYSENSIVEVIYQRLFVFALFIYLLIIITYAWYHM